MGYETQLQTYTGKAFDVAEPRIEDVDINDIAHALSQVNRFTGHTEVPYCHTPEQRVLTADLLWVPVGDLKTGDELIGFDEIGCQKGMAGHLNRRYRYSRITDCFNHKRNILRVEMEDGSFVRCSEEHPLLVATKSSGNQKWLTCKDIKTRLSEGRITHIHKFLNPWKEDKSKDAGWLAGIYDGEGSLFCGQGKGFQVNFAQNEGFVLDKALILMNKFGFNYGKSVSRNKNAECNHVSTKGGWTTSAELLGTIRPVRLLDKFKNKLISGQLDYQLNKKTDPIKIVKIYNDGEAYVSGISTSTRTYFCEGFGSHNSVAEHSVRVSRLVKQEFALEALLHDASEAYIADMATPVKRTVNMKGYLELEETIQTVCEEAFGVFSTDESHAIVKKADLIMLKAEALEFLKEPLIPAWRQYIQDIQIPDNFREFPVGWGSKHAESKFLVRFYELKPNHKMISPSKVKSK